MDPFCRPVRLKRLQAPPPLPKNRTSVPLKFMIFPRRFLKVYGIQVRSGAPGPGVWTCTEISYPAALNRPPTLFHTTKRLYPTGSEVLSALVFDARARSPLSAAAQTSFSKGCRVVVTVAVVQKTYYSSSPQTQTQRRREAVRELSFERSDNLLAEPPHYPEIDEYELQIVSWDAHTGQVVASQGSGLLLESVLVDAERLDVRSVRLRGSLALSGSSLSADVGRPAKAFV